ncbi:hypothetical protein SAMN05421805_104175 [Saccharopolyspora antimicrobica]|uniref:Uncharacterized protein n=1 Tax=Saccharopolyspora antimicrobica TaxID=455193 RepID=A0A1I4YKZ8_9PSEU|nr:hypothetical protein [Saccharopolyspora antimicrobica]RKT82704.1 hypothetical protein ATL45_0959 [Saccharopolyspora antimicrobica]SFN38229.1 hypothetical protein SAMN05421805_104175 [Saccharopolyspora antimicrobica]
MIAVMVAVVALLAMAAAWATYYFGSSSRPQHAGAGPGTLTVQQLIERLDAEARDGRHRLCEPAPRFRGPSTERADEQPRALPAMRAAPVLAGEFATPTDDVLRCVLDGLRRL